MVLASSRTAGLVGRVVGAHDRRKRSLQLTPAGERMLERLAEPARRAQERVLSAFSPRERETFLDLLDKFTRTFNETTRVPQVAQQSLPVIPRRREAASPRIHNHRPGRSIPARALSAPA